jgi:hypothetical protein
VRGGLSLVVALTVVPVMWARPAVAEGTSNPAFLGIVMDDVGTGIKVDEVTPGTGADRAGLMEKDIIVAMDGAPLPTLQASSGNPAGKSAVDILMGQITAHTVGDHVQLRVLRDGAFHDLTAVLSSRTDVMQQHLVGSGLDVTGVDLDSEATTDLGDLVIGHTTVIGWTVRDKNNSRCLGCIGVLARLDQRLHQKSSDAPRVVLVTSDRPDDVRRDRDEVARNMPVVVAEHKDIKRALELVDVRRLSVTISDARGEVQFVSLILPGADDEDAMIDEIVAAVDQANHRARH